MAVLGQLLGASSGRLAKFRRKPLMTATELRFFALLNEALPEFYVFPQVGMGALLDAASYRDRGRFSQKIVDFVVCQPGGMEVIAVVELDDRSHDRRRHRDRVRDSMVTAGGYRVVRWDCRMMPEVFDIRSTVLALLEA
jgi:very-short-patch-repair endonuclease